MRNYLTVSAFGEGQAPNKEEGAMALAALRKIKI